MFTYRCPKCGATQQTNNPRSEVAHICPKSGRDVRKRIIQFELIEEPK